MKRNKGAKQSRDTLQVWSLNQARAAIPYLNSVTSALRDHYLQAQTYRHKLQRLAKKPGRPTKVDLLAQQEAEAEIRQAESLFEDDAAELEALDVYVVDAIRAQALIPFVHEEQLAWFLFDLFDQKPFRFWRFQTDPDDTRRPITATQQGWSGTTQLA